MAFAQGQSTTTTLTITAAGQPVTSVSQGTLITLTAAVSSGSAHVSTGQVLFCVAQAKLCTDINQVGSAQLTSAGTAVLQFHPTTGSHSYIAVYLGTPNGAPVYTSSTSAAASLAVVGTSSTVIQQTGYVGDYALTATVLATGSPIGPTGTISFVDVTDNNAAIASSSLSPSAAGVYFTNTANVASNPIPGPLAVGDFNGDGNLDLVVASLLSPTLSILLGNGDGTFTPGGSTAVGAAPSFIAVGDFNGDGKLDLALDGGSTILLGNGDGTFTATAQSPAAVGLSGPAAVGDFNGDGKLDLAVANSSSSNVTILLGNGDGTFTAAPAKPATGSQPSSIAAGDFNADGKLDLAVSNSGSVTILLGNGDGSFTSTTLSPTAIPAIGPVVGDFNRDGKLDLAFVRSYFSVSTLLILLGNGDGSFTAAPDSPSLEYFTASVAVGDFNADGIPDLAVVESGPDVIIQNNLPFIYLGKGDGTFTPPQSFQSVSPYSNSLITSLVLGDFNGDGIPDVAVAQRPSGDPRTSINNVSAFTAVLFANASATVPNVALSGVGTKTVEASYPGDNNFTASVSPTINLTAAAAAAAPTFSPPAGTYRSAQTVAISDASSGASIYYTLDGTTPTPASAAYAAPLTISNSTTVRAMAYGGSYGVSPVASASYVINAANPTPTLVVSPGSSTITTAQSLIVTVTISGPAGNPTPTGSVTLTSGTYNSGASTLTSGSATITIPAAVLALGSDTITAAYSGDTNYASASGTGSVTVSAPPGFTVSASPTSVSVAPGASATSTITLTEFSGFSGTANLTCAVTTTLTSVSNMPTCSLNPASVSFSGTTAPTSMLTVNTTAASSAENRFRTLFWPSAGGTVLALLLFSIKPRRHNWYIMIALLCLSIAFGLASCGGKGSTGGSGNPGTTAGPYTVIVTATSASQSTTAGTVTLTVQ